MKTSILTEASEHEMKLVQMGAKVQQINSKMCFVTFHINNFDIEYVYNINNKDEYFIERIKPYPLALKVTKTEKELIKVIEIDLAQFKNASQSHNMQSFIEIGNNLNLVIKKFEDLFLYYNISEADCAVFQDQIDLLLKHIESTKDHSQRVYFEKEPDNL